MQYLSKNMTPRYPEIVRAKGIRIWDKDGNMYYDMTSQTLNLNLGHRHPAVMDALRDFISTEDRPYYLSPRFESERTNALAEKLVRFAPDGLNRVNLQMCNGSDANEDAFKRTRKYQHTQNKAHKKMMVSFYGSHLGLTSEMISASGENFGKDYLGGSGNYVFMNPPNTFRRPKRVTIEEHANMKVAEFEKLVKMRGDVAGIIMELLPFDPGILVQPKEFVKGIERVCNENDIAMIVDEIQTAFGWCGDIFLSNIYGVKPDVITLAKGLTAGFPALSATVFKEKYDILEPNTSELTFGAQAIGCTAALANIDYLEKSGILSTIEPKHRQIESHFNRMREKYPSIGDVRGVGLIMAMEFVRPDGSPDSHVGTRIFDEAFKRGLLVELPYTDEEIFSVVCVKPPITITPEEIDETMKVLDEAIGSVVG